MLVLSRKSQESVVVGGINAADRKLIVTVLGIRGAKVQLGFDVPPDVPVHRREVWERIHAGVEGDNAQTVRDLPATKGVVISRPK
ncbi:MAG TPA: carbon storage regulator [Pirellulales bacterium]|nr:carbon storage regulator [Pirellulales bacterium]